VTALSEEDLRVYGQPYPTRDSRRPPLHWPRSLPLAGEPADVVARVSAFDAWLASSPEVPKLPLRSDPGPGTLMGPEILDWCVANIAGLDGEKLGLAGHHTPEDDQRDAIAAGIAAWAVGVPCQDIAGRSRPLGTGRRPGRRGHGLGVGSFPS
jgi:haloalkane dehalogenase